MKSLQIKLPRELPRGTLSRFWRKVNKTSQCWEWTASTAGSYGWFWLSSELGGAAAHRVAWTWKNGPIDDDSLQVLHKCDNKLCVKPSHLFLGTHQDNMKDMADKMIGINKLPIVTLPGDTSIKDVMAQCRTENLRPTIDCATMQWVLRPRLRRVK